MVVQHSNRYSSPQEKENRSPLSHHTVLIDGTIEFLELRKQISHRVLCSLPLLLFAILFCFVLLRRIAQAQVRTLERSKMGSGAGSFLKVVLKNFDVLAGPVVSLVYPLYASIRAIESKSPVDDQQWLTYWVLYSLITLFELTFYKVIEWIPIWPYAKLILTCWLVLPYFSGAAYVYEHYVRPFFINPQNINIWYVPRKKDHFSKPDDILTAAEKYIQENGTEAFENLINRADKSRRNSGNSMYDESYGY